MKYVSCNKTANQGNHRSSKIFLSTTLKPTLIDYLVTVALAKLSSAFIHHTVYSILLPSEILLLERQGSDSRQSYGSCLRAQQQKLIELELPTFWSLTRSLNTLNLMCSIQESNHKTTRMRILHDTTTPVVQGCDISVSKCKENTQKYKDFTRAKLW